MTATIVINIASNGYLVQYQSVQGGTDSKVYSFKDSDKVLKLIESWMEVESDEDR